MIRFIAIGGCLLALVFLTAACSARLQELSPSGSTTTGTATPSPAPQILPTTVQKAPTLAPTPPAVPDDASERGSPAPVVPSAHDSAGVENAPGGDAVQGPTPEQQALLASLPDRGQAPELDNEVWLNSTPLRLADLRGKVVLLDMWTFGCINCIHTIPSLRQWHKTYGPQGLVVIGNHMPEFSHERNLDNVKSALVRLDVPYAVAIDNDARTWRAYSNHYWPSLYLIDKKGHIRFTHIGEGNYEHTEEIIRALLAERA